MKNTGQMKGGNYNDSQNEMGLRENKSLASKSTIIVNDLFIESASSKQITNALSFSVSPGERLAIIGPEGAGKSTIVEFLAGIERDGFIYTGQVTNLGTAGYLPQELNSSWEQVDVMEFLFKQTVTELFDLDNWSRLGEVQKCLAKVGLDEEVLSQTVGTLSGGQKVRIQLAKILLRKPSCLLLDEPTNNLDIETIKWLEKFLIKSRIPILFVSHDEALIRNVATAILYLAYRAYDNRAFSYYSGEGYDDFISRLEQSVEKAENEKAGLRREVRSLTIKQAEFNNRLAGASNYQRGAGAAEKSTMRRGAAKSSNRSGAKEQKIEALKEKISNFEIPHYERDGHIDFPSDCAIPNGKRVLILHDMPVNIAGKTIVEAVNLNVIGPEKVGIIGINGVGKSTLIRMISSINHLEGIRVGYMPQDFREVLGTPYISALDFLKEQGMPEGSAQTYLSRMKFCKEEMHSDIGSLSGGQRGKLIILLMAIKKANFLILDEPTRNLSPLTAPVLRQELSDYPGAILVVSHDRLFLSKVCTRVLELTKAGLQPIEKESLYN